MALYKLTAPRQFGDMPKGYEFQVPSATTPTPNAQDVERQSKDWVLINKHNLIKVQEILK